MSSSAFSPDSSAVLGGIDYIKILVRLVHAVEITSARADELSSPNATYQYGFPSTSSQYLVCLSQRPAFPMVAMRYQPAPDAFPISWTPDFAD